MSRADQRITSTTLNEALDLGAQFSFAVEKFGTDRTTRPRFEYDSRFDLESGKPRLKYAIRRNRMFGDILISASMPPSAIVSRLEMVNTVGLSFA
jgi:hypothetical protein